MEAEWFVYRRNDKCRAYHKEGNLDLYSVDRQSEKHRGQALYLLESHPSELNGITKRWSQLEMSHDNAVDSQALLELKKANCDQHQCLACPIGHKIISTDI